MASEEELAGIRPDTLTNTITKTELELGKLAPNLQAIAEYRKKEELYLNRVAELDQVPVQPHSALPDVFFLECSTGVVSVGICLVVLLCSTELALFCYRVFYRSHR